MVFALPRLSLQAKFGSRGTDEAFRLFQSESGKNLLFKDSTKCLQEIPSGDSFEKFLGPEYMTAMSSLRTCTESTPGLYRGGFSLSSDSGRPAHDRNNTCYCSPQIWRKPARSIPVNRKTSGDQGTRGLPNTSFTLPKLALSILLLIVELIKTAPNPQINCSRLIPEPLLNNVVTFVLSIVASLNFPK